MYLIHGTYKMTVPQLVRLAERYTKSLNHLSSISLAREYKLVEAEPAGFDSYRNVHTDQYVRLLESVYQENKTVRGILSEAVAFERIGVGGTLMATRLALSERCITYHLGGGYHHGMSDRPNGIDYCNDVAIALAQSFSCGIEKVLYVDLDAHHPDGVQKIFENDPRILQVSLHGWPSHTNEGHYSFIGMGAGRGKKINMPLPSHTGDNIYLKILNTLLMSVMQNYQPELVFYQAGVDPYYHDPVGCLNLSLRGLYERDKLVVTMCTRKPIPLVVVLGGGYDPLNTPRAIINTLAALAGKEIVFDEQKSLGAPTSTKAIRWYGSLRTYLWEYLELQPIKEI